MRNSYGIPFTSRALRKLKTIIAGALLAYALFTLINLGSTASAAPEPAARPEAAAVATETGTGPAAAPAAAGPAVDGEVVMVVVLLGLLAAYVVVRKVLAPIARGELPFGAANPGL